MSAKSAKARKRLHPQPKVSPLERVQQLDLSYEFTHPLPSPKYSPTSTKHSDHLAAPCIQRSPSPTPSLADLPDYRSTYSSHMDNYIPFAITKNSTERDNQYNTSYQPPVASGSSLLLPHTQLAALSISHESKPLFRQLPSIPNSNHSSSTNSSKHSSHECHRDSTSVSGYSGLSATPSSLNVFFPGSHSSKIYPVSPIALSPMQSESNHPDNWPNLNEAVLGLSDDYKRNLKSAPSVPKVPPEKFVYPTSRSPAQPKKKISSKTKSSKSSTHSSKSSNDDNSGRLRVNIGDFFKKKDKGKSTSHEKGILEESSHEFTVHQEQTRKLKFSHLLDPYNPVLLDNDRHTCELLSRLNPTGSPSFHNYGTKPPSSVLDLGCGQGHWVLKAAIAWKAYGTHVTGYDMVDIPTNLLPWAAEQGVRNNIQFVKGNFLNPLPFSVDTFDLVRMSCLALCITLDSWSFILQEVCRVLVAGGRLEFVDDQIFFPYGNVSSLTDIDEGQDHSYDHGGGGKVLHDHKGKVRARLSNAQPPVKPSIALSPEAWDRSLSMSKGLEELFEDMLLDAFDIHKDPSDFILPFMKKIFGQAEEIETMNLVLAPPESTSKSGRSPQQGLSGLSHCPGLILRPSTLRPSSTFIPMDHTEVEIHASKHLRTLLSCKNFLGQHAMKVAELENERLDEEFVSQSLWEYEQAVWEYERFNPPIPASGSSVMPNKLTHVRTFRVLEAVKKKKKLGLTY